MYDTNLEMTRKEGRRKNYFISLQGATACMPRDTVSEDPVKEKEEEPNGDEEAVADNSDTGIMMDKTEGEVEHKKKEGHQPNFIQRILTRYYNILHRVRWLSLIMCLGAIGIASYYSTTIELPDTLDVRILDESIQYEQSEHWRKNLLQESLGESDLSGYVFWGIVPADTGNYSK